MMVFSVDMNRTTYTTLNVELYYIFATTSVGTGIHTGLCSVLRRIFLLSFK